MSEDVVEIKKDNKNIKTVLLVIVTAIISVAFSIGATYYIIGKNNQTKQERIVVYQNVPNGIREIIDSADVSDVVDLVENSVVEIYTEHVTYSNFIGSYISTGAGSGVVYTDDGYIITNNHVIEDANDVKVRLHDGTRYDAVVVASDEVTDLAVIKIDAQNLTPVILGNHENLKTGQHIIVIGNPLGTLGGTVTDGIISALSRQVTIDSIPMTLLQTNASINPGNSGGGMFDVNGNLIGIVNAKKVGSEIEGIGFAIPIDIVASVAEDLIVDGYVSGRTELDIEFVEINNIQTAWYYNVNNYGLYVTKINDEDLINDGLRVGDVIFEIGGFDVTSEKMLKAALSQLQANQEITILVKRNNLEVKITTKLKEIGNK